MKLLRSTRYSEWWEYKLVPLLSIGYATVIGFDLSFEKSVPRLIFLLTAIIVGAVYVSIINDISDIKEDAKAAKTNRMTSVHPVWQSLAVLLCVSTGIYFGQEIYPDRLTLCFYVMAWIVFSLYSIPPVRLKKRGLWGVCCDASGAHLFPTLLIVSGLFYINNSAVDLSWLIITGLWAFIYGLRGILWHQFHDRENDLKSGTTTFASKTNPVLFSSTERIIFVAEALIFSVLTYKVFNLWMMLSIFLYLILVLIRKKSFKYKTVLIIEPKSAPYQLLLNDYYLVFFPISLLLTGSLNYTNFWLVFLGHILLFPQKIIFVVKDYITFFKKQL